MFIKQHIMLSRGRYFDRASGGAHFITFPPRTQVPKPRQLWWWQTRGLRHESRFPEFPQMKYLGGDSIILQSSPLLALFDSKSDFPKWFAGLDSLVIYQSYIALCEIRFWIVTGVRTVGPIRSPLKGGRRKSQATFPWSTNPMASTNYQRKV